MKQKKRLFAGMFSVFLSVCISVCSMSGMAVAASGDSEYSEEEENEWQDPEYPNDNEPNEDNPQEETGRKILLGTQQETEEIQIAYGETGSFVLDTASEASVYTLYKERISEVVYTLLESEDGIEVEEEGWFSAYGFGKFKLQVTVYDEEDEKIEGLDRIFSLAVSFDMTQVKAEKKKFEVFQSANDYGWWNDTPENSFDIKLNGFPEGITEETPGLGFAVSVKEAVLGANADLYDGSLHVNITGFGTIHMTVTILGKDFNFTFIIREVKLKGSTSFYMTPKQTKTLKVKNGQTAVWKSTDSKVVSVTKKGKIKAKKTGTAFISAKVKGIYVGCVISVVSKARLKVVKRARYIGTHWTYDQDKRMQKGYYDCSALVWKAYQNEKKTFGSGSYAPVAADVAKYCANHKKLIKGNIEKKLQKMKIQPGALTFKSGKPNGRYKNIYHVEMFTGYTLEWIDDKGKPQLGLTWGARDGYYDYGETWAQP